MTTKLYQTDAYLRETDVRIMDKTVIDGRPAVQLDRTIFYPTSGGQMHDTGRLNDSRVVEARIVDEKIWHLLSDPLQSDQAHAVLDWDRRFDFMQQHTAFHILAGSFLRLFKIETLSSHLGEETSTIDVDAAEVSPEMMHRIENDSNRIVWEDRPVRIRLVSEEEAHALSVRKEAAVSGTVRLIEIQDHDLDPCGGTHVSSTAQVGLVKIIGRERVRKNMRFTFVAGKRALSLLQNYHNICQELSVALTTGIDELVAAVNGLMSEQKGLRKKLRDQARLIGETRLLEIVHRAKSEKIVDHIFVDMDMETLRWMAGTAVKQQPGVYLFASTGERVILVFAAAGYDLDLRPIFQDVLSKIDGRGGGEAGFVQGSGNKVEDLEAAMTAAKKDVQKFLQ
ncbi:hypothetical protein JXO59_10980 [candidate division KSB1 bacterium]|nr:hypothetical protein [candidate division KSB1 bacterium]